MENFRTPNFELVAELLFWLLQRCGYPGHAVHMRQLKSMLHPVSIAGMIRGQRYRMTSTLRQSGCNFSSQ